MIIDHENKYNSCFFLLLGALYQLLHTPNANLALILADQRRISITILFLLENRN